MSRQTDTFMRTLTLTLTWLFIEKMKTTWDKKQSKANQTFITFFFLFPWFSKTHPVLIIFDCIRTFPFEKCKIHHRNIVSMTSHLILWVANASLPKRRPLLLVDHAEGHQSRKKNMTMFWARILLITLS